MSNAAVQHVLQSLPPAARLGIAVNIPRILVADWESLVDNLGLSDPRACALANAADEIGILVNVMFADVPRFGPWREHLGSLRPPLDQVWGRVDIDLRQVDWALKELVTSVE